MTDKQYNALLKAYTKKALPSMTKTEIRNRVSETNASIYCQQFDIFKNVAISLN